MCGARPLAFQTNSKGVNQVRLINSLKSRKDAEEGFTLIELMVVVLIIAILIAIAIPTFLGARERAQDRAAQSDLRNGLTAEKVYYTDSEAYTTTVADLQDIEPSLDWGTAPSVTVSAVPHPQVVCLSQTSKSGTVFSLADVATGTGAGTYYNRGACTTGPFTGWTQDGW